MREDTRFSSLPHILEVENNQARAVISLFGGQILSFTPKHDGIERLWMSPIAIFDGKTPIRGGIPICWPWFGKAPDEKQGPNHGYVRNQLWVLINCEHDENNTQLDFEPTEASNSALSYHAKLQLSINIGKTLSVELCTQNLSQTSCTFNAALHTYFNIRNIADLTLEGITGNYIDQIDNNRIKTTPLNYRFNQEIDRIHLCPEQPVMIRDECDINVKSKGNDSIVIWNPWHSKSKTLKDMPDNGYHNMICVETAITQGIQLTTEQSHKLVQIIE